MSKNAIIFKTTIEKVSHNRLMNMFQNWIGSTNNDDVFSS